MDVLLEFSNVSFNYKKKQVVHNLTFSLHKGEVIAMLGPSGCGKTTVLNITPGLLKNSGGQVNIHTKDVSYVFQEPRLLPWRTVIDNVKFVIRHKDKSVKQHEAEKVLQRVGLLDAAHDYPSQLSGGMKQRVSIARALASNPDIILMDEPFSALVPELKKELQTDVIRLIEEQDVGVIYVTHDPAEALFIADRILVFSSHGCSIQCEMKLDRPRRARDYQYVKKFAQKIHPWVGGLAYVETD